MTVSEKIFARHMRERVETGLPRPSNPETQVSPKPISLQPRIRNPHGSHFLRALRGQDAKVNDSKSILFFRDHLTFLDEVISEEKKN